jgi:repressor LexA
MGWQRDSERYREISTKKLPLLGRIACGAPIYDTSEYGSFCTPGADIEADFCLTASGDSMIGARIFDGDIVFIRAQDTVENGEIAAVVIEDEATLKRVYFYPEKNKLILSPENPKYEPLIFSGEELNSVKILGKAVAYQSRLL